MYQSVSEKIQALEKAAPEIPGVIIVHSIEKMTVEYMSPRGLSELNVTLEELQQINGEEYHRRYFNPEDAADYTPKLIALLERGDENESVTFFQQVRISPNTDFTWHLSSTKIFWKNESGATTHIITHACPVDPLHHITSKVNRLLEENNFLRKNNELFAGLTIREKQILVHMAQGMTTEEIAEKLHISQATASTHRKNIRNKIKAENQYDITYFAQAFNLI